MAFVTFPCDCGATLRLPADKDGRVVTCPKCGRPAYTPGARTKLDELVKEEEQPQAKMPEVGPSRGRRRAVPLPPPVPEQDPDEVEELRREVRQLRRQVEDTEPKPKKKMSPAAAFVVSLAILFALFMICRGGRALDDNDGKGFYGMTAQECVARWGRPGRIEGGERVGAFVYPAAGVKVIISGGRVVRFDDLRGNRLNSYEADERLRGLR